MMRIINLSILLCIPFLTSLLSCQTSLETSEPKAEMPNIILIMADDLGWGDTGYNGHDILKTPHLDQMAIEGIRFNRFYSAAPVCSPTRGSCMTGRHPYRYGILFACTGHMRPQEVTLAEALKSKGYTTGHFGKWHLGTLSTTKEQNRWGPWAKNPVENYAPPWEHGFDVCFSTESKVPTWNPMKIPEGWKQGNPGDRFGNDYWIGEEKIATDNLEGDDSRIIMDRVIPFIEKVVHQGKPFFAVIWFHAPHSPVVAGPEYQKMYSDRPENEQHYYGCITAMDEQIGRLREKLTDFGIADNTMLLFCSDNGPARQGRERHIGSNGPFHGYKASLWEGGIRVPGLLVWPEKITSSQSIDIPISTSDIYPTIRDLLGFKIQNQPEPLDGISLLPLLKGEMTQRNSFIAFESGKQQALIGDRFKIIRTDTEKDFELFDIINDPAEIHNIAGKRPALLYNMLDTFMKWQKSCTESEQGKDYK